MQFVDGSIILTRQELSALLRRVVLSEPQEEQPAEVEEVEEVETSEEQEGEEQPDEGQEAVA